MEKSISYEDMGVKVKFEKRSEGGFAIVFEEDGKLSVGKHEEVKNNSPFYQTLLQKGEKR